MFDLIKRLLAFLLPIIKSAALETAADLTHEAAYGRRPVKPYRKPLMRPDGYARYNRLAAPRTQREAVRNVGRAVREVDEFGKFTRPGERFHDVLMVAFDLTGPNAMITQQWLMEQLPKTGDHDVEDGGNVNLDAWWIADDNGLCGTDCDSAVFVRRGEQEAARKLLRENGLVD